MRRHRGFFIFIVLNLSVMAMLYILSLIAVSMHHNFSKDMSDVVKTLKLTDMVLSTESRYARNPSQADLFSAFQDYPCSIEHFPTGSVIPLPDFSSTGTDAEIKMK